MISILCPSRGRPDKAFNMALSAIEMAVNKIQILFYLNEDDHFLGEYKELLKKFSKHGVIVYVGKDQPPNKSWNDLATVAKGDLLMVCGDDIEFKTKGWDELLKNAVPEDGLAVLSVNDLRGGENSHPHPIYTRKTYELLGYVMWPGFFHWYGDTWAEKLGKGIDRHIWLENVVVAHKKPSDDGIIDETHARIRRNGWHDRDTKLWQSDACQRALLNEISHLNEVKKRIYS